MLTKFETIDKEELSDLLKQCHRTVWSVEKLHKAKTQGLQKTI